MNRLLNRLLARLLLLAAVLAAGCYGEYWSDAPLAMPSDPQPLDPTSAWSSAPDTVVLDRAASVIAWQGTKMWGRGRHTGTVPLKAGHLLFRDDRLVGGAVTADLTALAITDIPPDQPAPIALLTKHLKDPLFFDVAQYPEAQFVMTSTANAAGSLAVSGNLTVKGVTRHVTLPVAVLPVASSGRPGRRYHTRFRIDRFRWNVAYEGGFGASRLAARNFVDRYIELTITLVPREEEQAFQTPSVP